MFKDMVLELRAKLTDLEVQFDFEKKAAEDVAYAKGLADGKAGGDSDAKIYSQAEANQMVADAIASLPADTTPFAQADIDAAVATATAQMKSELDAMKLSAEQKDAIEESIALKMKELAESVSALTVKEEAPVADPGM